MLAARRPLFTLYGGGGYNIQLDRLQHTIFKPQPVEIGIYKRYTEERTEIQKEKPRARALAAPAPRLPPAVAAPRGSPRPRARCMSERLRGCGGSASDSALRRSSSTPTNTKLRCTTANSVSAVRASLEFRFPCRGWGPLVLWCILYTYTRDDSRFSLTKHPGS